jgi:regulator of replication initiation timing
MEERIDQLEEEARRLGREVAALRGHFRAEQEIEQLRAENAHLREVVVRYAVACAQVDLQVAIVRARGGESAAADESLKTLMAEEQDASRVLRDIAKQLQQAE